MPRKPRFAPPNYPLHITQRGNYRQPVFFTDEDRNRFLTLVDQHADDRRVLVHGYALMSNHFHLVVTGREDGAVSRLLQQVTGQYAQYLHGRLNRRGRLWQSRFYSCVLDAHHFLSALAYVDLNPVRARVVDCAVDSAWTSAAAHCGLAAAIPEWLELESLHSRVTTAGWRERLGQPEPRGEVAALRRATRTEVRWESRALSRNWRSSFRCGCDRCRRGLRPKSQRKRRSFLSRSRARRGLEVDCRKGGGCSISHLLLTAVARS